MKKWLALMATGAILGSGFAQDQFDNQIAFSRGPDKKQKDQYGQNNQNDQNGMNKTKLFLGYKFFVTQTGDNESSDNYAVLTNTDSGVVTTVKQNSNYDWDFGHFGTIGVQLKDTMFKLFFEGWLFRNKKQRTIEEATANDALSIGTAFPNAAFSGPFDPTKLKACSRNDFYMVDFLISYAAYRKGNFFLLPYLGPRFAFGKHNVQATFSNATNSAVLTNNSKRTGFGTVFAVMAKYFFTNSFYAYGDLRYSLIFTRQTDFTSQTGSVQTVGSSLDITFDTDQILENAYGIGFIVVNRKDWNVTVDASYKLLRWAGAHIHYQALGLGVIVGF